MSFEVMCPYYHPLDFSLSFDLISHLPGIVRKSMRIACLGQGTKGAKELISFVSTIARQILGTVPAEQPAGRPAGLSTWKNASNAIGQWLVVHQTAQETSVPIASSQLWWSLHQ